jgi:2-phospho-L-lactate guanylyltransferase
VVPVKRLSAAKSRLAPAAGAPRRREALALAFACDTVAEALRCAAVRGVAVVTDDPRVARELCGTAEIVADEPGTGLNAALEHGAAAARALWGPAAPVAALSADLPALRAAELGRVLEAAGRFGRAFLRDAAGVGTTLLGCAPGAALRPLFEGGSAARHAASGAAEIDAGGRGFASVRRDVDTGADLAEAVRLGVGARTAAVLGAAVPGR